MPKVSVIIPTFNRGSFITQAIDSVLKQNYQNFEIIVVDDGSTDDTQAKLSVYYDKIKYIYQPNQGIASARNTGVKACSGEYIAFLDSDDIWLSEKLVIQTQILDADPYIGLTYSTMIIYDELGRYRGIKPSGNPGTNFHELIEQGGHYPTSTVMIRRKCLSRVGLFDENFAMLEDFDMWLRISKTYQIFAFVEKPLAVYRWHAQNSIKDEFLMYQCQVKLYRKILQNFPEASPMIVLHKLARHQYILSKFYFYRCHYRVAFTNLLEALKIYPGVGSSFWNKNETYLGKTTKMIKPYFFLGLCSVKKIFNNSDE